jgi:hypothetical protein
VLYVRYDGHYGLIDPRAEGVEPTVIPQISPPRTERCEADQGKPAHLQARQRAQRETAPRRQPPGAPLPGGPQFLRWTPAHPRPGEARRLLDDRYGERRPIRAG